MHLNGIRRQAALHTAPPEVSAFKCWGIGVKIHQNHSSASYRRCLVICAEFQCSVNVYVPFWASILGYEVFPNRVCPCTTAPRWAFPTGTDPVHFPYDSARGSIRSTCSIGRCALFAPGMDCRRAWNGSSTPSPRGRICDRPPPVGAGFGVGRVGWRLYRPPRAACGTMG